MSRSSRMAASTGVALQLFHRLHAAGRLPNPDACALALVAVAVIVGRLVLELRVVAEAARVVAVLPVVVCTQPSGRMGQHPDPALRRGSAFLPARSGSPFAIGCCHANRSSHAGLPLGRAGAVSPRRLRRMSAHELTISAFARIRKYGSELGFPVASSAHKASVRWRITGSQTWARTGPAAASVASSSPASSQ